ncbi:MgtC/SapB family protein [Jeotgalibaca sp. A122]|uniref:MgtC/SapB family protein n=1 Tax=Jeotgalibaca sp. A122 TaxID=3457322 RepID=UPI003FCEF469
MYDLDNVEIALRLLVAVALGFAVGVERERKNQSAGIRTNIIVCVSACILTIIQVELSYIIIRMVLDNPELAGSISTDFSRIVAQIVSGIGFLGAGAIITTQVDKVSGLTTAATIWAVSGLGIAVGFGYYFLAVTTTMILVAVLYLLKLVTKPGDKYILDIKMTNREQIKEIRELFTLYNLRTTDEDFEMTRVNDEPVYHFTFTVYIPKKIEPSDLITEFLSIGESIVGISFKD